MSFITAPAVHNEEYHNHAFFQYWSCAVKPLLHRIHEKYQREWNFTDASIFYVAGDGDIAIVALINAGSSQKRWKPFFVNHFTKGIFAPVLALIVTDIGAGYRFEAFMLFICTYGASVARNPPDICRKACGKRSFIKSSDDIKRNILRQIFCFAVVSCLLKAKIKNSFSM